MFGTASLKHSSNPIPQLSVTPSKQSSYHANRWSKMNKEDDDQLLQN
jgi:hypothetical protein